MFRRPLQVLESAAELGGSISHNFALFAQKNLKGTALPLPQPGQAPVAQPKTLPHALSRAAASATVELGEGDRLGTALSQYSLAMGKVRLYFYISATSPCSAASAGAWAGRCAASRGGERDGIDSRGLTVTSLLVSNRQVGEARLHQDGEVSRQLPAPSSTITCC